MVPQEYWLGIVLVAVVVISAVLNLVRGHQSRTRRDAFLKAQTRSHSDFKEAYAQARKRLSDNWAVIEIIHDWSEYNLGPAGLPAAITSEHAFEIVRQIRAARDEPIAVIIHTMGGYSMPTDVIAQTLAQHRGRKVAFVPYVAMSGGTVIALAADEIVMGTAAALGPIDTQYWDWPAKAWAHLKKSKAPDRIDDLHLVKAFLAEQFEQGAVDNAKRRINKNHGPNVAEELIRSGRHHGETISPEEARKMRIKVPHGDCPKDIYALVDAKLGMLSKAREQIAMRDFRMPGTETVGDQRAPQT